MRFYALEGLDGVGKTTLAKNLSDAGYSVYKTPPKKYEFLRKEIHNLKETSLFYYMSSIAYVLEVEASDKNNFFLDRYIFSTLTQYISNTTISIEDLKNLFNLFSPKIQFPTITFFINLNYEERMKRIKNRTLDEKLLDNENRQYNDFWIEAMNEYDYSKKIILDGTKSEQELVKEVISYMKD